MIALTGKVEGAIKKRADFQKGKGNKKGSRTEAPPPCREKPCPFSASYRWQGHHPLASFSDADAKVRTILEKNNTEKHVIKHARICYKTYF